MQKRKNKKAKNFGITVVWEYEDGTWHTEIIEEDVIPKETTQNIVKFIEEYKDNTGVFDD